MSKFLGPIHYWLYHKIQLQNNLVDYLIDDDCTAFATQDLRAKLVANYGPLITGELETIIDGTNIHGWLNQQVIQSEYRLAMTVTEILNIAKENKHPSIEELLLGAFNKKGQQVTTLDTQTTPIEAYKLMDDLLVDGMPCDRAKVILSQNEKEIIWKRNQCVHQTYWTEMGTTTEFYYRLRDAFILGLLEPTQLIYAHLATDQFQISEKR